MATPIDGFDQSTIQLALQANPDVRQRIASMLQQNGDRRTPEQWLYAGTQADAQRGYVNPEFQGIITGALQQQGRVQPAPQAPTTPDLPADQFNQLVAAANNGDQSAIAKLQAAGYEQSSDTQSLPIEQGLLQQALPSLLGDVSADEGRRTLAGQLTGDATNAYTKAIDAFSPEANAARLQEEYNQANKTGGEIAGSAATSAADQLAALQASIASMQGNLTGDLAAKAQALQDQIASLNSNLDTLDASQKATLAQQIAANQKNLEDSISSQRESLGTEIASLRNAADAQSQARAAALQKEVDSLTAAQAPMAKARLDSANALATSVNMGLQSTTDAMTANRLKQGYIGSSTFDNAALARASIGARQQAAQALGGAREQNASDIRDITTHGATEGRSIADQLAANMAGISGQEATGTKSLADLLASGTQSIGDTSAAGQAGISGQTATGKYNVGNAGAAQTFQDQVFGADQKRSLADALASGGAGIAGTLATQQQQARDATTNAKQGYFDNAYTRGLSGNLAIPGLTSSLASNLTALDNYGNSGLNRSLGALNWWALGPNQAPVNQYQAVQADNSGNQLSALGTGVLGAAVGLGNANNWWQTPKTTTPTGYTTPAGNVGVQTDWSKAFT